MKGIELIAIKFRLIDRKKKKEREKKEKISSRPIFLNFNFLGQVSRAQMEAKLEREVRQKEAAEMLAKS